MVVREQTPLHGSFESSKTGTARASSTGQEGHLPMGKWRMRLSPESLQERLGVLRSGRLRRASEHLRGRRQTRTSSAVCGRSFWPVGKEAAASARAARARRRPSETVRNTRRKVLLASPDTRSRRTRGAARPHGRDRVSLAPQVCRRGVCGLPRAARSVSAGRSGDGGGHS